MGPFEAGADGLQSMQAVVGVELAALGTGVGAELGRCKAAGPSSGRCCW